MPITRIVLADRLKRTLRTSKLGTWITNAILRDFSVGELEAFLASGCSVELPPVERPELTVIVLLDARADLTLNCLTSLTHGNLTSSEFLCVGTAFSDATKGLIPRFSGLKHLELPAGTSPAQAINRGASAAQGEYVLIVPNTVAVVPNTVSSVRQMIRTLPDAVGAVGGMVVDARGRIREAGISFDQSGKFIRYGLGDRALSLRYQFRRPVHCFLAAALLTRRDLFLELAGLGDTFSSVAIADYCLRLLKHNRQVLYDPTLTVLELQMHQDGPTPGLNGNAQKELGRLFLDRRSLGHQSSPSSRFDSNSRKRILFIEDRVPHPNLGQGYPRSHLILTMLVEMGYFVTLYPLGQPCEDWASAYRDLPRDVEILLGYGRARLAELLAERLDDFDLIFVSRPHNMEAFKAAIKKIPGRANSPTKVIYDAEALFSNREITLMRLQGHSPSDEQVRNKHTQEIRLTEDCYSVISVSDAERAEFLRHGVSRAYTLGHAIRLTPTPNRFDQRDTLLFVGGFSSQESPNADGLRWFCNAVLPLLQKLLGRKVKLIVAGATSLEGCPSDDSVTFKGIIPDLTPFYNQARVLVAPIRFAAGIPLKIYEASAHGLPVVTTPLLASQLNWLHGRELLVGESAEEFAIECAKLYQDESVWSDVRSSALHRMSVDGSIEAFSSKLRAIVEEAIKGAPHHHASSGALLRDCDNPQARP